jgi:hypothetical protein
VIRTYTELSTLTSFLDRFQYLQLNGQVGADTFGFDRYLNQTFYHSYEWKKIRDHVIIRDNGCDLGVPGYEINSRIYIHHMNPISLEDIEARVSDILNPEYLICCSHQTHNAIHYGSEELLPSEPIIRRPGDTKLW